MLICDKCANQIASDARFCPNCGDPVTEADLPAQVELSGGSVNIQVSFGYSSSPNYDTAVDLISGNPAYEIEGEGRKTRHSVLIGGVDVQLAIRLWDIVGGWKSSTMHINGEAASKSDLVYKGLGCYRSRQQSIQHDEYCYGEHVYEQNIWGCKRMGISIERLTSRWQQEYGRFGKDKKWHFDKAAIEADLRRKLHEHRFCPILRPDHVLGVLEALPGTVDPRTDTRWEYATERNWDGHKTVEKPVGVRLRRQGASEFAQHDLAVLEEEVAQREAEREAEIVASGDPYTITIGIDTGEREVRRIAPVKQPKAQQPGALPPVQNVNRTPRAQLAHQVSESTDSGVHSLFIALAVLVFLVMMVLLLS